MSPSPRAHVYRLLVVLAVGFAGFLVVKTLAVPKSWDSKRWYRTDAEEELKLQSLRFGGNASCTGSACHDGQQPGTHQSRFDTLGGGGHKGLACEVCHGPLDKHARDGKTVGHASMNSNNDLCLSCHEKLVTRPNQFPQFDEDLLYHRLLKVNRLSMCRACHDPHDPN